MTVVEYMMAPRILPKISAAIFSLLLIHGCVSNQVAGDRKHGDFERSLSYGGRNRTYAIHVPPAFDESKPSALVLVLHGGGGNARNAAFMTGFSLDIVDIARLRFYTFFTKKGLTLHQAGVSALSRFLNARLNLYSNVYFHRTTRALDLHLQEIFRETMDMILPASPADDLDAYLDCEEWRLFSEVRSWLDSADPRKRKLGREWEKLHHREVKWKMSFSAELSIDHICSLCDDLIAAHGNYLPKYR